MKEKVYGTVNRVLCRGVRKHQDWFDEHNKHLLCMIKNRNKARKACMQCNTRLKNYILKNTEQPLEVHPSDKNQIVGGKIQRTTDQGRQEEYE